MLSTTTSSGAVIAAPQVLQFAEEVGNDYVQVADKASQLGLNNAAGKNFLAQVFKTDRATVDRYFKNSAQSENAALQAESVSAVAAPHALQLTPRQASQVFAAVHGAGNPKISNIEVQGWLATPRVPTEILQAMVEHGLSAAQVGRALGWGAGQVQDVLAEYGLDAQSLIQKEAEGWSAQDFDRTLTALPEQEEQIAAQQQELATQVGRIEPLLQEARAAQDQAAQLQGEYDALNAQFEPAFAEYNALAQEQAGLQVTIASEQTQQAQGQDTLAHLDQIEERRMRRDTASKEAQYQIDNAAQSITAAQVRLTAIQARMSALEAWGRPLMEQTQAAQVRAQQAQQAASEKNAIAAAQGDVARRAADEYQAAVTGLSADQGRLVAYLQAHPQLEDTASVQASIWASIEHLDQTLSTQRQWTDAARAQGAQLDEHAQKLEADAEALRITLDPLQPARLQAEAQIQSAQQQLDATRNAQTQAQTDLDAAYQRRTEADYQSGKGGRNRSRDEAQRLVEFHTQQLNQATQQRQAAQAALDQAQTQGDTPRLNALQAQGQWQQAATVAGAARAQAWAQSQLGHQLLELEQGTQSALARSVTYGMALSQVKVEAARSSKASPQVLGALEKDLQANLRHSIEVLEHVEQSAVNDRFGAEQEQQRFIPLQAQAEGRQLIAQSWASDAADFQRADQALELPRLQENLNAAAQRLQQAQWAREQADMHLDWAEARVNAKKQGKALAAAQPAMQAAQAEEMQAQQAYDVAQAQLRHAQHLDDAVGALARDSGYLALSAMQGAQTAIGQANTQAQWTQAAQARDTGSDAVLATAQVGLIQSIQALADVQALRADGLGRSRDAQQLHAHSDQAKDWAQRYADTVADSREAQIATDAEQARLDALEIQTGAVQVFSHLLDDKVQRLTQGYEAAQAVLPDLQKTFESASAQAQSDRGAAEQAYQNMVGSEKNAEIEFIASRHKLKVSAESMLGPAAEELLQGKNLSGAAASVNAQVLVAALHGTAGFDPFAVVGVTPEQLQARAAQMAQEKNDEAWAQAQTDPDAFIKSEEKKELKGRKTGQKKLHWYDDKAQFVRDNAEVQAARAQAEATLQTVQQSSQAAVDAGEVFQAQTVATLLRATALSHSHDERAQAAQMSAELSQQTQTQATTLARAAQSEAQTAQRMVQALRQEVESNSSANASLYAPLVSNAEVSATVAQQRASEIQTKVQQWQATAADQQKAARLAQSESDAARNAIEGRMTALQATASDQAQALAQAGDTQLLVLQAQRDMTARAQFADQLHEQRLRADRVEKARKKKSLFATLVNVAALAASAVLTYFVPPLGLAMGESFLAAAAAGAGINAAAQGINLAAGFQDQWNTKSMVEMGAVGVLGAAMGTVTQSVGRMLRGTVLGNAVPGTAAVQTLVSNGDHLISPATMAVVTTQPAVAAIAAGPLSWVGTALSWGAGATVGSIAQQAFEMATGESKKFNWNAVKKAALQQALGGVLRIHFASSWAGSPYAPTLYRPMTAADMVIDVSKRFMGTLFIDTALYGAGLIERIDGGRLVAVAASRGVQLLVRDGLGQQVLTPDYPKVGDFVASHLGQSLIRSGTYLTQASVNALLGKEIDWDSTLYLGMGRATGQWGASWGEEKVLQLARGAQALVSGR